MSTMANTKSKNEGVIYTVERKYVGTCSVTTLIGSIIQSHYSTDAERKGDTINDDD